MAPNKFEMEDDKEVSEEMEVGEKSPRPKEQEPDIQQTDIQLSSEGTSFSVVKCVHVTPVQCSSPAMKCALLQPDKNKEIIKLNNVQAETSLRTTCDKSPSVKDKVCNSVVVETKVQAKEGVQESSGSKASSNKLLSIQTLAEDDPVVQKAYSLAKFVVESVISGKKVKHSDKIEESLIKNVNHLMTKHEILFCAMMRRLDINKETGYVTFVGVANELFENQKRIVTWSRIIALYAFGAQLSVYCKEKDFLEYAKNISMFLGKYVADMAGPFVKEQGGWGVLAEQFPGIDGEDEFGDNMWRFLTWTAVGLGIATATVFFTSSH